MKLTATMMLSLDGLDGLYQGEGMRLFPERGQSHDMTLVESRSMPAGVTILTYRPTGRVTIGNAGE